jgi:hypothetical protein
MVRGPRAILIALAVATSLAGCSSSSFDPENLTDKLDFLNPKKKLAGDRKPVFPNGVPGVQQGVPPELMKGYQSPSEPQVAADGQGQGGPGGQGGAAGRGAKSAQAGQAAVQPGAGAEEGQEAPPPKPKRVAAKPKPKPQPSPQAEPAQEPAPQRTAVPQQGQLAPWPNAPPPPATNTAQPAWPASPAPGTFQR